MTADTKLWYNKLPIGEWIERDKVCNTDNGSVIWGSQRALTWCYDRNLIELKFEGRVQYIRRRPTTEVMNLKK